MRLLIILALFMLPMTVAQFYSTDSYALTGNTQQETLFDKAMLPERQDSKISADEGLYLKKSAVTQVKNERTKVNTRPSLKTKKVRIVQGKRNANGMQLLTVLLKKKATNG